MKWQWSKSRLSKKVGWVLGAMVIVTLAANIIRDITVSDPVNPLVVALLIVAIFVEATTLLGVFKEARFILGLGFLLIGVGTFMAAIALQRADWLDMAFSTFLAGVAFLVVS